MAQIRLCTQQMDQMEMHFGLDQREEEELQHQHEENLGDLFLGKVSYCKVFFSNVQDTGSAK